MRSRAENKAELLNLVNTTKMLFDDVIVVDSIKEEIIDISEYKSMLSGKACSNICPLKNDECGCICGEAVSTDKDIFRLSISYDKAYLVISKHVKLGIRNCNVVFIKEMDNKVSFGDMSNKVDAIMNISSSLIKDQLTGLYNRKFVDDNSEAWVKSAIRNNKEMCLASIDIDNFKQFNDKYGHDFGDIVLKTLANCMKASVTKGMYPIRIGGDEFIVISTDGTYRKQFKAIMDKICKGIANIALDYKGTEVHISISIGTGSVLGNNVSNYKELYKCADEALYRAKEHGKNCVV